MNAAADPLRGLSMREPPHNIVAEQALLGAILCNNRALGAVEDCLKPEHFVDPVHARIFTIILRLAARGSVADALTLKADLEHDGILDECGGTAYLAQLVAAMVSVAHAADYARVVRDAWVRRTLLAELGDVLQGCFTPPEGGTAALLEQAESALLRIALNTGGEAPNVSLGAAVAEALAGTQAAARRGDGLAGLTTGYSALDRMTGGLRDGNFAVIGARPSMGKTALGLGIAVRCAADGNPTLYWSGEMTASQLAARAAAAHADIDTVAVFTARKLSMPDLPDQSDRRPLETSDWHALAAAERACAALPLEIDTRPAITVAALRARARRMMRQAAGLRLIVVDYLGLMRGTEVARRNGKYAEISEISADLLALSRELGLPVLALVQLNRASESREDKRPTMADLRDSGSIEQDAKQILLLHRPHYYLSRAPAPEKSAKETQETYADRCSAQLERTRASVGVAEILVTKNTHGPTGGTRLRFTDRTTWFRDEHEDPSGPAWSRLLEAPDGP